MEEQRDNRNRRVIVGISLMLVVFCLSYLFAPVARRTQKQMEQDLKTLPLPPETTETDFSSGYQPTKGITTRKIRSARSPREMCAFFTPVMIKNGWQELHEQCYPGDSGHALIEYHKKQFTSRILYIGEDVMGMTTYSIVSTWPRWPR